MMLPFQYRTIAILGVLGPVLAAPTTVGRLDDVSSINLFNDSNAV